MKVKIEVKLTNENTQFSTSSTSSVEGTLQEVIRTMCIDSGYALYTLNPDHNKGALTLLTLFPPEFSYNEKNRANYTLTKRQLLSMSRRDLIKEVKYLSDECEGLQSEICDLHSLMNQEVINK